MPSRLGKVYKRKRATYKHSDRAVHFRVTPRTVAVVQTVDLRSLMPKVLDQGNLGSCTSQAISLAYQYDQLRQGEKKQSFQPSRLFIYYNERKAEGDVSEDNGSQISTGIKLVAKTGVDPEQNGLTILVNLPTSPQQLAIPMPRTMFAVATTESCKIKPRLTRL